MVLPIPTSDDAYLKTAEFGFGKTYNNGTEFYESILNTMPVSDINPGKYVNSTILSTAVNGLALPL